MKNFCFGRGTPVRDAYIWGRRGNCPLIHEGAGGARVDLQTDLFPSFLSSEGAFSGIEDSMVQEYFSGGKFQNTKLPL